MDERIAAAWKLLPGYLGQHVLLSASALVLGLALSLPLAVAASRSPRVVVPSTAGTRAGGRPRLPEPCQKSRCRRPNLVRRWPPGSRGANKHDQNRRAAARSRS